MVNLGIALRTTSVHTPLYKPSYSQLQILHLRLTPTPEFLPQRRIPRLRPRNQVLSAHVRRLRRRCWPQRCESTMRGVEVRKQERPALKPIQRRVDPRLYTPCIIRSRCKSLTAVPFRELITQHQRSEFALTIPHRTRLLLLRWRLRTSRNPDTPVHAT